MLKNFKTIFYGLFIYLYAVFGLAEHVEECFAPDHLVSYLVDDFREQNLPENVSLIDQFLNEEIITDFHPVQRILTPAIKWHNGNRFVPNHPSTKYIAYPLQTNLQDYYDEKQVKVHNQFGVFDISIGSDDSCLNITSGLAELLVPSFQESCGGDCSNIKWIENDHYLCHLIDENDQAYNEYGIFQDQFQSARVFDSLRPAAFCNPVKKTHNGDVTDYDHSESNHLMCFYLDDTHNLAPSKLLSFLNQFGERDLLIKKDEAICVPSIKIEQDIVE